MWRQDIDVAVDVLTTRGKRVCAIRLCANDWKLLIVCVYMPHVDEADKTYYFVQQLVCIEQLIDNNSDCRIVVCG